MSGRAATTDVDPGRYALSVGNPEVQPRSGWLWVLLTDVAELATGHTPSRKFPEYWGGTIPWMSVGDARGFNGGVITSTKECTNELGLVNSAAVLLPKGTVCLSRTGSIGYVVITGQPMATSQGFVNWICSHLLLPRYLQLIFLSENEFLHEISEGVAHTTVYFPEVKAFWVCVPEPAIQARIIDKVDLALTQLDAGVAALERTQASLKRYRASVLKAACEGRLVPTEHELAQQENRDYETGEQLLARILTERRSAHDEAQKTATRKKKYKEPNAHNTTSLVTLPAGWQWTRLEQLGPVIGGLTKNPKRAELPIQLPYLRVANVYAAELRLAEIKVIGVKDTEVEKLLLSRGDLLIVEGNGSKDQIGRVAIWDGSVEPCVHQNHIIKVRPSQFCMSSWILYWLLSNEGRGHIEKVASSTTGLHTLSVGKVGNLPVPLPPLAEQERIVAEVERRLSVIDELEATVTTNLRRATRLRQAILKKAFTGGLTDVEKIEELGQASLEEALS